MAFLWSNRWVLTGTRVSHVKEHKSIFEKRRDPFWGECDICGQKDILVIKGGLHGLCLMCRTCSDELNNPNIKLSNTK
jgi:hypothetical protein